MMRAWTTALLTLVIMSGLGCGGDAKCKKGTVLLTVILPTPVAAGTQLDLEVVGGGLAIHGAATLDAAQRGTLELDLPQYPTGATVVISGSIAGLSGSTELTLSATCATATLTLAATEVDMSMPGDLAQPEADGGEGADMSPPPDLAPTPDMAQLPPDMACASGSRLCAGDCVVTSSTVWSSDDYACGAAGLICSAGSTCQAGACATATAASINAYSKGTLSDIMFVTGNTLYWTDNMGIDGDCNPAVTNNCYTGGCGDYYSGNTGAIAVVGGTLYYVSPASGAIHGTPDTCNGSQSVVYTDPNAIDFMATDGKSLFWTDDNGALMEWLNVSGTPGALVPTGPAHAQQLQVVTAGATTTVYYAAWGTGTTTGEIFAVPVGSGATALATNQAKPTFLTVAGNSIYWTNSGDGSVWTNTLTGNATTAHAIATGQSSPMGIVADTSAVYWVNNGDGSVMKQPACGGAAIKIASGQSAPTALVSINNNLYWLAAGNGTVDTIPQ
ncbi:MAG TPA: hypothetical protein VIA18_03210 [Polyangia bacterium]|nr:hypothetical protein [Polyangia bacterium]